MADRMALIGCSGAGKSTAARTLASLTGLPIHHLDRLYWRPGWVEPDEREWRAVQDALVTEPRWVIDGNYTTTLDIRLARADLVLLFDFPTWLCLWRVVRRVFGLRGQVRPDMGEGCPERFDLEFLIFVLTFRRAVLPRVRERVAASGVRCIILRSPGDVRRFLESVKASAGQV